MSNATLAKTTETLIPVQDTDADLHVASLIVYCRPESLADCSDWLLRQRGVEIHAQNEQGKLVVVMESHDAQDILDLIDAAHERPGIVNAALIYHEIVAPEEQQEAS